MAVTACRDVCERQSSVATAYGCSNERRLWRQVPATQGSDCAILCLVTSSAKKAFHSQRASIAHVRLYTVQQISARWFECPIGATMTTALGSCWLFQALRRFVSSSGIMLCLPFQCLGALSVDSRRRSNDTTVQTTRRCSLAL